MSKKTDFIRRILKEVSIRQSFPAKRDTERTLIDEAALVVLLRHMTETQALASLSKLRTAFPDWNECRVSQAQEIGQHLKAGRSRKGVDHARYNTAAAQELKEVLHEIFQKTHGLDLSFVREDVGKLSKPFFEMPLLGLTSASHLLFMAAGEQVPVHATMMRLLDKLGMIPKTSSIKKATESISKIMPKGMEYEFTLAMHEIIDLWEDEDNPSYERFGLLQDTTFGKKAHSDREALLKRLEVQRERDDERRRRDEERERKREEAEAKKRAKDAEALEKKRRRAAEKKRRELERQRKATAAARAKVDAEKKRISDAKKEEKQRIADAKKAERDRIKEAKAEVRRKEAEKKAAIRQAAADKKKAIADKKRAVVEKKRAAAAKKKASVAAAKKKASAKKPVKKPAAKKPVAKKTSSKKAAKKTTKKTTKKVTKKVTKKPAPKKPAVKKPVAKKKATKKPAARKVAKKATKKTVKKSTKKVTKKATKKTAKKATTKRRR